jgi:uncharacterized protein with GYD domain
MPHYIALMNWTEQGIKTFEASVERSEEAEAAMAAAGIKFKDIYWTIGAYDLIAILEAPDPETLTAALLKLGSQGNLRTSTLRAFTAEEMRGIIAKAS